MPSELSGTVNFVVVVGSSGAVEPGEGCRCYLVWFVGGELRIAIFVDGAKAVEDPWRCLWVVFASNEV